MATLYEIAGQYAQLYAELEDAQSEADAEAILEQIDAIDTDLAGKAEAYAKVCRNLTAAADAMRNEEKRLASRRTIAENAVTRLKDRMAWAMGQANASKVQTTIGNWALRKNPPHVVITCEDEIPIDYMIAQPMKVDKTAIMSRYKETGEVVPGTTVETGTGIAFR